MNGGGRRPAGWVDWRERVGGWREAENYEEKERVLEESEEARETNERK